MVKKEPEESRQQIRFKPIPRDILKEHAEAIAHWAGVLIAASDEMEGLGMKNVKIDGHGAFLAASKRIVESAQLIKALVEVEKMKKPPKK